MGKRELSWISWQGGQIRPFLWLILLVLAASLPYLSSLGNAFVWDDENIVLKNRSIRDLWEGLSSWGRGPLAQRPVTNFSFAWDYWLWGFNPWGYHLTNLVLHVVDTLLFYEMSRVILADSRAAILAGLIFASHPVHSEAVVSLLGRSDLLAAFFFLMAFQLYLWASPGMTAESQSLGPKRSRKVLFYGLFLACYGLSMLSKEMGVTLPLILIAYERLLRFPQGWRAWWEARRGFYLLLALTGAVYLLGWSQVMGINLLGGSRYWGGSLYKTALMMSTVFADYLRLLLFPWKLCCWYVTPVPASALEVSVLFSLALVALAVGGGLWGLRRSPRASLGLWWFLLALLPVSNLIPIAGTMMAERWLYLPSAGVALIGGTLLARAFTSERELPAPYGKGALSLAFSLLVGLYALRTWERGKDWKDDATLFRQAVETCPADSELFHNNLGVAHQRSGRLELAIREYRRALQIEPRYLDALLNLGSAYDERGETDAALRAYQEALGIDERSAQAHYNLGNLYGKQGQLDLAVGEWQKALAARPDFSQAHNQLGNVYFLQGRLDLAVREYEAALRADPDNVEGDYNLGLALEQLGRTAEALAHYRRFVERAPAEYEIQRKEIQARLHYLFPGPTSSSRGRTGSGPPAPWGQRPPR